MPDNNYSQDSKKNHLYYRILTFITIFMLCLTGMGQMPIFKRYYIADIPGFAWLAEFYTTHFLHYCFAAVFLGICSYQITDFLLNKKQKKIFDIHNYIKVLLYSGLIGTGILLVIRNFPLYWLSPESIFILDIVHLGLAFLLILHIIYLQFSRKQVNQ